MITGMYLSVEIAFSVISNQQETLFVCSTSWLMDGLTCWLWLSNVYITLSYTLQYMYTWYVHVALFIHHVYTLPCHTHMSLSHTRHRYAMQTKHDGHWPMWVTRVSNISPGSVATLSQVIRFLVFKLSAKSHSEIMFKVGWRLVWLQFYWSLFWSIVANTTGFSVPPYGAYLKCQQTVMLITIMKK